MKNKVLIMLMGFFLFAHQLFAQDVSVSGNVKDEKGDPKGNAIHIPMIPQSMMKPKK